MAGAGAPIPSGDCAIPECARFKWEVLCDNGTAPATSFLRCYFVDCESGDIDATVDLELDGFTSYALIGDAGVCTGDINVPPTNVVDAELVCFDADPTPLVRITVYDPQDGSLVAGPFWRDPATGAPAVPAGSVIPCPDAEIDVEVKCLCDDDFDPAVPFLRVFTYTDGLLTDASDFELDGSTPYVVSGDAVLCGAAGDCNDTELEILTDTGTDPDTDFLRRYLYDCDGTLVDFEDTELDGSTPYVPIGPIQISVRSGKDIEQEILCDVQGDNSIVRFLRRYRWRNNGTLQDFDDFELDGTAYAPTGTVLSCGEAESDGVQSGYGGDPVYTRVVGDYNGGAGPAAAQHITDPTARRVQVFWTSTAASVGNRATMGIDGGPQIPLPNNVGLVEIGTLETTTELGFTITIETNQNNDDAGVLEEF